MKKLVIIASLLLLSSSALFHACTDSCEGITCEYDGECENGVCICTDLTENYLVGTWTLSETGGTVGTFKADNTYVDSFGNVVAWVLDQSSRTITLTPGNKLIISEDGFSCEQMNVTIDNGSTLKDFVFVRQ